MARHVEPLEFYRKIKNSNTKIFVRTNFSARHFFSNRCAYFSDPNDQPICTPRVSHTDHFEARYQISDSSTSKSESAATQDIIQSSCCRYLKIWKSLTLEKSCISKTQKKGSFRRIQAIQRKFYSR